MRIVAALFIIFAAGGGALCAAESPDTIIKEVAGSGMEADSTPGGAEVYIDGVLRGKTPVVLPDVSGESHSIRFSKDGYEDWTRNVSFSRSGRLYVHARLLPVRGLVRLKLFDAVSGKALDGRAASVLADMLPVRPEFRNDAGGEAVPVLSLSEGKKGLTVRYFGYEEERFAVTVEKNKPVEPEVRLKPAVLRIERVFLNRKTFNPNNSADLGAVTLNFYVSAPSQGRLTVLDAAGRQIYSEDIGRFGDFSQSARWNGKTTEGTVAPEGRYAVRVDAESAGARASGEAAVFVDYSAQIIPVSLLRPRPGLAEAEYARSLPAGSWRLSATLLTGSYPGESRAFSRIPFVLGFNIAPLDVLDVSASVHLVPRLDKDSSILPGGGFSVRGNFIKGSGAVPAVSAGLSLNFVGGERSTESGMDAGFAVNAAFAWHSRYGLALLLSPGILWSGPRGYPEESIPRFDAGGGILFSRGAWLAGVSSRSLLTLNGNSPIRASAELFWFPPPSHLVFGLILQSVFLSAVRFSGGFSLGIIR